jgi:uncharacterized protein
MRILISGSSGLVGTALRQKLQGPDHEILRLVRRSPNKEAGEFLWNPATKECDLTGIGSLDAVIHLAGKSVADNRWSDKNKKEIEDSRILGTQILVDELIKLETPPGVLISASAIGIYGNRGPEILHEESSLSDDFLSKVCQGWETATKKATEHGIRVVNARIGLVLSKNGGALKKMLLPFKMAVGGRLGSGTQYMSWISIHDLIQSFMFCIENKEMVGPYNAVSPTPLTNIGFTKSLGRVLGRPTIFPVPAFMLRLIFGEIADWLLLVSQRVEPTILNQTSFKFQHTDLDEAFKAVLA